jgi:hypothetical protein
MRMPNLPEFARRVDRYTYWMGHIFMAAAIIHLPLDIASYFWTDEPWGLFWGNQVLFLVLFFGAILHEIGAMCERCMQRVPADAAYQAQQKQRRWMWNFHLGTSWWFLGPLLLAGSISIQIGSVHFPPVGILGAIWYVFWSYSWRRHSLLRPWCPYCSGWDEGGEHEHVPNPDPSMSKTT